MSHRGQKWRLFQLLEIRWSLHVSLDTSYLRRLDAASLIVLEEVLGTNGNGLWEGLDPAFLIVSHLSVNDLISALSSRLSSMVLRHNII